MVCIHPGDRKKSSPVPYLYFWKEKEIKMKEIRFKVNRYTIGFAITIILFGLIFCARGIVNRKNFYEGKQYYTSKYFEDAFFYFRKVPKESKYYKEAHQLIQKIPNEAFHHYRLKGINLLKEKKFYEAMNIFRKAKKWSPQEKDSLVSDNYYLEAITLFDENLFKRVNKYLKESLKWNPKNGFSKKFLGWIEKGLKRVKVEKERVEALFGKEIYKSSHYKEPTPTYHLDYDKAKRLWGMKWVNAVAHTESASFYGDAIWAFRSNDLLEEAKKRLKESLGWDPKNEKAISFLNWVEEGLKRQKDYQSACDAAEKRRKENEVLETGFMLEYPELYRELKFYYEHPEFAYP